MANNAHEPGCKVRALDSLGGHTVDKLADARNERRGEAAGPMREWNQLEHQKAAKRSVLQGRWHWCSPGHFYLGDCMSAQQEVCDSQKCMAKCCKAFGPPVTEVDWQWLVAEMAETSTVEELK